MKFIFFLFGLVVTFTISYSFTQVISPVNNSIVTNLNQTISATISGTENVSTFIDWDNSLVGYWNFDSGNSTHVFDLSKQGNNGIYFNGKNNSKVDGVRGNYSYFDGINSYIRIGTNLYESNNVGTISLWVKRISNGPSEEYSFSSSVYSSSNNYLGVRFENMIPVFQFYSGGSNDFVFPSTLRLINNSWNHLVISSDGDKYIIYLNSIKVNLSITSGSNSGRWFSDLATGTHNIDIGRRVRSTDTYYFNGSIDEVMIFNRNLSDREVLALYNSQVNNFEFNATNLNNNTQYNYTMYSINTTGDLVQESYNFFTNTSYLPPSISSEDSTLFPSFSFISVFLSLVVLFFYF